MKFIIENATNCDPVNNRLIANPTFRSVARKNGFKAGKQLLSIFCCLCCCVDGPDTSLILQYADKLGIPPENLINDSEEDAVNFVISFVQKNSDGELEKTPLVFSNNMKIARAILNELNQIYIESSAINLLLSHNTPSLNELDSHAKIWNQLFGLPAISKGSQEIKTQCGIVRAQIESQELNSARNAGYSRS